jgi:hypothetical protein
MIALPLLAAAMTLPDLDDLRTHITRCDRPAVSRIFSDEPQRRADFLIGAAQEQDAIARARVQIVERRRKLSASGATNTDNADAINAAAQELDDRQQALNDRRAVDALYRDTLNFLRQHYLASCAQGTKNALNP